MPPVQHGITLNEPVTGIRSFTPASTAIIGLIATTTPTGDQVEGDLFAAFPTDTPVLVTDINAAIAQTGGGGTLRPALQAIADQAQPIVVVVRVAEEALPATQDTRVIGDVNVGQARGLQALKTAEAQLGVRPRIIACPGLESPAVIEEMVTIARALRGFAYAAAEGDDVAAAVTFAGTFDARELMLFWPKTKDVFGGDAVARAIGLRSKIDQQTGWHKTISNVPVNGVLGLSSDVHFDMLTTATDAGVLNDAGITTIVNQGGYRFWGNRTQSSDPTWRFESRVRTAQALQDTIASGLRWAIDLPLTPQLVRDVSESINAEFRRLVAQGRLIGGEVLPLDTDINTAAYLASGQITIDFEFTDTAPLEGLTLNQRITDRFYANFATALDGL